MLSWSLRISLNSLKFLNFGLNEVALFQNFFLFCRLVWHRCPNILPSITATYCRETGQMMLEVVMGACLYFCNFDRC